MARLQDILDKLTAAPDPVERSKGEDYTWDLLKELEKRRIAALKYEINRLSGLLEKEL